MKLVSIIIPVYNREKMVVEAINSCLKQDYQNIEIIVINDGSTDKTKENVEIMQEQYQNISLINQENQGVTKARIAGLKKANGEYVMFLDSDDLINKNYVSSLVNTLEETKTSVALARKYQIMGPLHILYNKYPNFMDLKKDKINLLSIYITIWGKLYKRDNLEIFDFSLKAHEDLAYVYYDLAKKRYISCTNKAIYTQRFAENSLAKNLIYGNLEHIENTIKPLEIEHNLFSKSNLLDEYEKELEIIFIKKIFERIFNIWISKESKNNKNELINCLLKYLNFYFPNWRTNKYYLNNFNIFPLDYKFFLTIGLFLTKNIITNEVSGCEETINDFNAILRK